MIKADMGIRKTGRMVGACWIASAIALAAGPGPGSSNPNTARQVSLHIPDESAPPGGVVQMKFMVTEPTPISSGGPRLSLSAEFDAVLGVELFCPAGDVNGAAVVNGSQVQVFYTTTAGAQGTDYPIMTLALHVRDDAPPGAKTQFSLDPSSTWMLGLLGPATLKPVPPATVTVTGSVSITNVVPGGGVLPAGTVVSIYGKGFQPHTQVQLNAIRAFPIEIVSPNEIRFTLSEATNMTGQKLHVVNPDGSQDTYFSYLRGVPQMQSQRPLLQHSVPIFSAVTHSKAVFGPFLTLMKDQFSGLALQNPGLVPADVTISLYSFNNALLGTGTLSLLPGHRSIADLSEFLNGVNPPPGSSVVVSATQPVQSFGFVADGAAGVLYPFGARAAVP